MNYKQIFVVRNYDRKTQWLCPELKEFFMSDNELTEQILKAAFTVHSALGPGLLESSYKACLIYELLRSGLYVESEKPMPLIYQEIKLDIGYRLDLLVERKVVRGN